MNCSQYDIYNKAIRLETDGLSFWEMPSSGSLVNKKSEVYISTGEDNRAQVLNDKARALWGEEYGNNGLMALIDTPRAILIPSDIDYKAKKLAEFHNYHLDGSDELIITPEIDGTVAVMICDKAAINLLQENFANVSFASPLQYNLLLNSMAEPSKTKAPRIFCHFATQNVYVNVFTETKSMIFAQRLPTVNTEDVLFYLKQIENSAAISKSKLYLSGYGSLGKYRFLRKYYAHCICV